jgi:hypothetical protein
MPSTSANLSGGRYGKSNTITGYSGSNSSNYGKDSYNYSNKGREESNRIIFIDLHNIVVCLRFIFSTNELSKKICRL